MAKYFFNPFAVTGNRLAVPEAAQPSGNLSYEEGFPINYQLDPATDPQAKLIERQQFNQFMYDITLAIQQYQQFSVPDFITAAENGGSAFSYSQFARVRYDPGSGTKVYESLVNTNTALPTDATKWAQVTAGGGGGVPAGAMLAFGGTTAPDGWLLCYGQAVSRTTYSTLFTAIGTNYGTGDGINTFNLPDKRGRVSVGKDDMGGTPANRITNGVAGFVGTQIGANGGNQNVQQHSHTAVVTDPSHSHSYAGYGRNGGFGPPAGGIMFLANPNDGNNTATASATTGISVANNNYGTGASANVQPSEVDSWIIKI